MIPVLGMTVDDFSGIFIVGLVMAYLVYALLRPEKL